MASKIPKGEIIWESIYENGILKYVVTSKQTRDLYFLYEVRGDDVSKVGKGKTPPDLMKGLKKR